MIELREFGCILPSDIENINKYCTIVEKSGFDHIRLSDHSISLMPNVEFSDAWTMLPIVGIKTKHAMISHGVTDPYRRHPVELAQGIATLDRITNGRAALGIGAGESMNLTKFGIRWKAPLTRLKEAVITVKKLWVATSKNPCDFEGRIFTLRKAYLQIKPIQKPHPPIYIGALGTCTRKLTGELADGWLPWIETPKTYKEHLEDIENGAKKARRKIEEVDRVASFYSAVSDDYEEAYRSVEYVARMALVLERSVAERNGHKIMLPEEVTIQRIIPQTQLIDKMNNAMQEIPSELVDKITVIGSVENCINKIEKYLKAGATSVSMVNVAPNIDKTYELYGKTIIPYFKEQYGVER